MNNIEHYNTIVLVGLLISEYETSMYVFFIKAHKQVYKAGHVQQISNKTTIESIISPLLNLDLQLIFPLFLCVNSMKDIKKQAKD